PFDATDGFSVSTDPVPSLLSGDYTLTVDGVGDFTGGYQFRLHDLAQATPLSPGTPVNGTLDPASETDLYRFTASAGDRFFFDVHARSGIFNPHWRLIDPLGNVLFLRSFTSFSMEIGPVGLLTLDRS